MMATKYVPERSDIIWISLNPQAGHEQAGRRPVLVLSPSSYNKDVIKQVSKKLNTLIQI